MIKLFHSILLCLFFVAGFSQDTLRTTLMFTGDIMQHDSQISAALVPGPINYNYAACFQYMRSTLSKPDLTIGNLELTFAGPPYKGYPQFSAPDQLLPALKEAGFDVLVTANNHCVDRGRLGLERTIDLLDSLHVPHTGTFKDTLDRLNEYPLKLESKGIRLSLLNYTYGTNGLTVQSPNLVNRIDTSQIRIDLDRARLQGADVIIIFFHWGKEYESLPLPWQKQLADFCFSHGAKIVVGSHPHVIQPMEWRKESDHVVAYSLGNFVSGQRDRYRNGGALLNITLEKIVATGKTSIRDVNYSLAFVYRDADPRRTYYLLPVEDFEGDTTLLKSKAARESIIQFRDDTRTLFQRENKSIEEKRKDKD